jgi:glycerate 2-kinase
MNHHGDSNAPKVHTSPIITLAPDSFKGTLAAHHAAAALKKGLVEILPQAKILECPMADGGEGTLKALQSAISEGMLQPHVVSGASGLPKAAHLFLCNIHQHPAAVIEVADVVGLTDAVAIAHPCGRRTTHGVGELIQVALAQGIRAIYIGLGGSSTNDGGAGLLVALGAKLLDSEGQPIQEASPAGLNRLAYIDCTALNPLLQETHLEILSDVDNPLCGPHGATHTFGLQKGLRRESERDRIDRDLAYFATLAEQAMNQPLSVHNQPGAGAAGGLGFALQLLGGTYTSGANFMATLMGLPQNLAQSDWLITGEGCSDRQTLRGKVPWVVAKMAPQGLRKTLLSGKIQPDARETLQTVFEDCYELLPESACLFQTDRPSREQCLDDTFAVMVRAGAELGRLWQRSQSSL